MITIALLDPHPIVHKGFKSFFRKNDQINVAETFRNSSDLFDYINTNPIDVLVTELELPDESAVRIIKRMKIEFPKTAVIIFTSLPQSVFGISLLKAGASGYLSKEINKTVMTEAIEKVAKHGFQITSNFANGINNNVDLSRTRNAYETLSPREI